MSNVSRKGLQQTKTEMKKQTKNLILEVSGNVMY